MTTSAQAGRDKVPAEGPDTFLVLFLRCVAHFTVSIYGNCILRNATQKVVDFGFMTELTFSEKTIKIIILR